MGKYQLNGWQRLWVLVGVIYLVVIAIVTISVVPKRSQLISGWAYDAVDLIKAHEKVDSSNWTLRKGVFGDASDEEIVTKITTGAAKTEDKDWRIKVKELEAKHTKRLDGLLGEQLRAVGIAILVWFVPVVLLYALGYGVGWVYRGFRNR